MHVMLIHQAFVSPNGSGGTRHYELGRRFVESGHQFSIVASELEYSSGKKAEVELNEAGEEEYDGVKVHRAYTYAAIHTSYLWRVISFLSFMISSVWKGFWVKDIDMVMGTSPPIFQAFSAWVVSFIRRKPFLLEVRDLWPEFAIDIGLLKSPFLIWVARRLEMFLYRRAKHLLVNSPAYRDYLIEKGVPAEKISFIANGVDVAMFADATPDRSLREQYGLEEKFILTYTGAIGMANDLDCVLDAAALLDGRSDAHFLIVGDGKERPRLETRLAEMGLNNVTFAGSMAKSAMPGILADSDACLATLKNIPMFKTTYPNKVFDYMAAARPIILGIDGVIREVVEAADGGIAVPPGNPERLAEAVQDLASDASHSAEMGASAKEYVRLHFNRDDQAVQFQDLMVRVGTKRAA